MIKTISTVSTNNYYQQRYSDISHAYKNYYSTSTSSLKEDSSSKEGVDHSSNDNNTQQVVQSQTPPLSSLSSPSPFGNTTNNNSKRRKKKRIIPRKAAVELTEKARIIFQKLLDNQPTKEGILLNYTQSATGEPRMVFSFSFVSKEELDEQDEGISLVVDEDGNPKSPRDSIDDGLPKLYVHHNAFMKVLGATVDVDTETITPILYDKEGFEMDSQL
ncbi:hypothetical protein FRACYDRAFT_186294 [Fragilariopsis cylindrus CCMP1102]|uniref:Uncharacterized protein n=1 Tax=Fragilariopsis cylindrus CCMP1102 TaxID=635003 RepID=A0A1E7FFM8_9STRA|nr:hypothetical protein FRACYDRAFT_186294 [Fragilariopsis cylindrus CCMP1102]|eukprot:OEU16970.1 hypothetical protein FRACYDRAFT_186294 [Fragilariopsis cylindrus CCMP1102]